MEAMKRVGFFDSNIFLYYEDDDLCLRARQAGYGLVLAHEAAAVHAKGASSGAVKPEVEFDKQKHMIWSRLYIEKKYRGGKSSAGGWRCACALAGCAFKAVCLVLPAV